MTKPTKGSIEIDDCSTGDWSEPLLSLKAMISAYEDAMLKGQHEDAMLYAISIRLEASDLKFRTKAYYGR